MNKVVLLWLLASVSLIAQSTADSNARRIERALREGSLEQLIEALSQPFARTDQAVRRLPVTERPKASELLVSALWGPATQQHQRRSDIMAEAIRGLSALKQPNTLLEVARAVDTADWLVRGKALDAIESWHEPAAIPFVTQAFEKSYLNLYEYLRVLGSIGGPEAANLVLSLRQRAEKEGAMEGWIKSTARVSREGHALVLSLVLDKDPKINRQWAAEALNADSADVRRALMAALDARDLAVIAGKLQFYISVGRPGSEPILVEAFERFGLANHGTSYVEAFLNSGNEILRNKAYQVAKDRNIRIVGSGGGKGPWGSLK